MHISCQKVVVVASWGAGDEPVPGATVITPERLQELLGITTGNTTGYSGGDRYSVHTMVPYSYPFRQTDEDRKRSFRYPQVVSQPCSLVLLYHPDRDNAAPLVIEG